MRKFKASEYYLVHKNLTHSPYVKVEAYNSDGVLLQKGTRFYDVNIDIMNIEQIFAINWFEDKKVTNLPYHQVIYIDQQDKRSYHQVLLNGNTGEIIP